LRPYLSKSEFTTDFKTELIFWNQNDVIAVVAKQPELAQQQPTVYGQQVLIEKVENLV
jgi:hypothetical protein